ncbi:MAG: UrcA family protein [Proteobacteria bacterium]|nr:UrcA family protein [Pseudomonadota bacterium]
MRKAIVTLAAALLAGAAMSSVSAQAETYNKVVYGPDGTEHVIVQIPRDRMRSYPDGTVKLSRDVSYADLDLTTRDGARELRERVRFTARDVCEDLWSRTTKPGERVENSDLQRCAHDAYRDAMRQVHDVVADARDDEYYDR